MSDSGSRNILDRIKGFDLNLLTVFEMVYLNSSVTKAAKALGTSPSAVSQSLQKLREHFSDPLFIRLGKGISATTVADTLHEQIAESMGLLDRTISDPQDVGLKNKFVIYSPPVLTMSFMPLVVRLLQDEGMDCGIMHFSSHTQGCSTEDLLNLRQADIVLATMPHSSFSTICVPCLKEEVVLICRHDHPRLRDRVLTKQLATEKFAVMFSSDASLHPRYFKLMKIVEDGNFIFRSNSLLTTLSVIEHSEAVGFVSKRLLRRFGSVFNVREVATEFEIPPIKLYLVYNRVSGYNKAFTYFLERLTKEIACLE